MVLCLEELELILDAVTGVRSGELERLTGLRGRLRNTTTWSVFIYFTKSPAYMAATDRYFHNWIICRLLSWWILQCIKSPKNFSQKIGFSSQFSRAQRDVFKMLLLSTIQRLLIHTLMTKKPLHLRRWNQHIFAQLSKQVATSFLIKSTNHWHIVADLPASKQEIYSPPVGWSKSRPSVWNQILDAHPSLNHFQPAQKQTNEKSSLQILVPVVCMYVSCCWNLCLSLDVCVGLFRNIRLTSEINPLRR